MTAGNRVGPEVLAQLRELNRRYPNTPEIIHPLAAALKECKDWNGLIALHRDNPQADATINDLQLARLLTQAGYFNDALQILRPLHAQMPQDVPVTWLTAYSAYYAGDEQAAAGMLDRSWEALKQAGKSDAIVIRALIHFHADEFSSALSVLEQAPAELRQTVPFNNTLGRVLAAMGEHERAAVHLNLTKQLLDTQSAFESRTGRLIGKSRQLNAAMKERRLTDAERIVREMLTTADQPLQAKLYLNLAEIYRNTGRDRLAAEATSKATQLASKEGAP